LGISDRINHFCGQSSQKGLTYFHKIAIEPALQFRNPTDPKKRTDSQ